MFRIVKAAVTLVALVGVYQVAAGANGVSVPPSPGPSASPSRPVTPEEMAIEAYNSGISHRDRAVKAEGQAAKDKKESDRAKNDKKAREEHEKALKDFTKAASLNPSLPQAYNGMGFSYRKLGDYAKALENYDRALQLSPKFPDAIEYPRRGVSRLEPARRCQAVVLDALCDGPQAGRQPDGGDEELRRQEEGRSVRRRCCGPVCVRELDHRARRRCRGDEVDGVQRASRILAVDRGSRPQRTRATDTTNHG